jgi:hypothetical protein
MGSRGKDSGKTSNSQRAGTLAGLFEEDNLHGFPQNTSIANRNIDAKSSSASGVGVDLFSQTDDIDLKKCVCCGQKTLHKGSISEICPACGWQDDKYQNRYPDYSGDPNHISLNEARAAWTTKKAAKNKNY